MVRLMTNERGFSLIEVLIATALLGIIAVAFLAVLSTASRVVFIADERAVAESLARSQMEWVKGLPYVRYAVRYDPAPIPREHAGFSVTIAAVPIDPGTGRAFSPPVKDLGIQKITVSVSHGVKVVITLEGFKGDR